MPNFPEKFPRHEWLYEPDLVKQKTIDTMADLRRWSDEAIYIHVAVEFSGHAKHSYHYKGEAVDFHWKPGQLSYLEQLILLMSHPDAGGIGFYPRWKPCPGWHIDTRVVTRKILWTRANGVYSYGPRAVANAINMATTQDKLNGKRGE